ncbi:LPS O-antigen chain length determinant protein WzzB, partial [Salmonella enterica subsp. enterica serovar Enteritidis]|nr:LPS O-antigen chain length determinant protein WzzB [Salmonella enterica subsp. enterica serovar Enteritidis]
MTVDSNTSSGRGNDPEQIDLIELLLQLWRGKMTIIVAVIIAILLAVGYLMIAKEKWTSTAIITQPDAALAATVNDRFELT